MPWPAWHCSAGCRGATTPHPLHPFVRAAAALFKAKGASTPKNKRRDDRAAAMQMRYEDDAQKSILPDLTEPTHKIAAAAYMGACWRGACVCPALPPARPPPTPAHPPAHPPRPSPLRAFAVARAAPRGADALALVDAELGRYGLASEGAAAQEWLASCGWQARPDAACTAWVEKYWLPIAKQASQGASQRQARKRYRDKRRQRQQQQLAGLGAQRQQQQAGHESAQRQPPQPAGQEALLQALQAEHGAFASLMPLPAAPAAEAPPTAPAAKRHRGEEEEET